MLLFTNGMWSSSVLIVQGKAQYEKSFETAALILVSQQLLTGFKKINNQFLLTTTDYYLILLDN